MMPKTAVLWLAIASSFLFVEWTHAAEPKKQNILFICVDDLKPLIGCYGDPTAQTPNLDALAKRGVRFDNAFCNQAVCSPSRNSLLTGFRPQTLGIYDLGTNFRAAKPAAVTLPQAFKSAGYRTEALGKIFHVGHGNHEDPASWSVPQMQVKSIGYAADENKAEGTTREEALFANDFAKPIGKLPRGAAYESADVADDVYADGKLAIEAIKRIENLAKMPDTPFFLAVGFVKPHLPFCAPKKYWDLYDPAKLKPAELKKPPEGAPGRAPTQWGELRAYKAMPEQGPVDEATQRKLIHGYYAAVSYMDAQLGKVVTALDAAKLSDDTIIVLWGDHGWHLGDHGMWCKHTNYEQAARIPLIVVAPQGAQDVGSPAMIETVDIYPTLLELAGQKPVTGLDGRSFAATVREPQTAARDHVTHVYPRNKWIGRAIRTPRYRLVEWKIPDASPESAELELYDLQDDPDETKNYAAEKPQVVAELRALLIKQPEAKPQISAGEENDERNGQKKSAAKKADAKKVEPKQPATP